MKHIQTFESFLNESSPVKVGKVYVADAESIMAPLRSGGGATTLTKGDEVKITKVNADGKPNQYLATIVNAKTANAGDSVLITKIDDFVKK